MCHDAALLDRSKHDVQTMLWTRLPDWSGKLESNTTTYQARATHLLTQDLQMAYLLPVCPLPGLTLRWNRGQETDAAALCASFVVR